MWHIPTLLHSLWVAQVLAVEFGGKQDVSGALHDFLLQEALFSGRSGSQRVPVDGSETSSRSDDEACCKKKKGELRWALFVRFMNNLPTRRLQQRSQSPAAWKTGYDLYCNLENVSSFHYIDVEHRSVPDKNWLRENPFGTEEVNNWASGYIEKNQKLLYGPLVPKTGTTTISGCFNRQRKKRRFRPESNQTDAKLETLKFSNFDGNPEEYTMLTAIRDPLDRFFSAHSQIEAFAHMGWFTASSWRENWNLTFLDKHCPISYWAYKSVGFKISPSLQSKQISPLDFRLDRVEAYLEDIEMKGFFNWHNHPITKFLAEVASLGLLKHMNGFIDTKNIIPHVKKHWQRSFNKTLQCKNFKSMSSGTNSWAVTGEQLIYAAYNRKEAKVSAKARDILRRICMVYALDFRCMSFKIPKECKDMQLDSRKPNLPIPLNVDMSPENSPCCKRVEQAKQKRGEDFAEGAHATAHRPSGGFSSDKEGRQCFLKSLEYYKELNFEVYNYPTSKPDPTAECISNSLPPFTFASSPDGNQLYVPPLPADPNLVAARNKGVEVVVQDPIMRILLAYNRLEVRSRLHYNMHLIHCCPSQ
jgi:hypothetical protein